ncbi:Uncharacterised protein [Campylobacter hyointestinalis]|nr:hypothetical protein CHH_0060 [Campylobacter hyointestinalis subsp. hyointestinalis LMG 9260]KEA44086.1 hypothetical protein CR67_06545 [Campylobacter hyointestinalis subsp. hyointestinalis]QKF54947.1 hypothetical protein CHHT_0060 [Campylobacter hyointestinalis subsp. hyointestinalis]SFT60075.1 hypothetical protein SAMN05421691_1391 [Campylobacter hyointestinalis]SUW89670.1 Uncharacterised protein [Campylobacter hyointestinalis]
MYRNICWAIINNYKKIIFFIKNISRELNDSANHKRLKYIRFTKPHNPNLAKPDDSLEECYL